MMSLTFGLFTQVGDSGPHGPLVFLYRVLNKVNERYKPDVVVCQCGADGVFGDPMESFNLTPLSLGRCVQLMLSWKLPVMLLGGGTSLTLYLPLTDISVKIYYHGNPTDGNTSCFITAV